MASSSPGPGYHAGELEAQARAGVTERARKIGGSIHATIPEVAARFLEAQPFLILAAESADVPGRTWATLLTGPLPVARALDPSTIRLTAEPAEGDPLCGAFREGAHVGLLAIDLAARRRMRVNGRLHAEPGGWVVATDQVYSNCPKYIQARTVRPVPAAPAPGVGPEHSHRLTDDQRHIIARADTFFLATGLPAVGADASHRGGRPGFIRLIDEHTLVWPDYAGNSMFNSLGNILAHPATGLLFVDFASGRTLQLAGQAEVDWTRAHAKGIPGAERLVRFRVEEVVVRAGDLPLEFGEPAFSPHLPAE